MAWFHNEKLSNCINGKLKAIKNWPVCPLYLQYYFHLRAKLIGRNLSTITFFNKQTVYNQLALKWHMAQPTFTNNKNYRLKKSWGFLL